MCAQLSENNYEVNLELCNIKSEGIEPQNVCSTCLERGDFKLFYQTYYHNNTPEDYTQMLSYCYALQIAYREESDQNYYICDACISKLRSATLFRKQIEMSQNNFNELFNDVAVFNCTYNKNTVDEPDLEPYYKPSVDSILKTNEIGRIKTDSEQCINISEKNCVVEKKNKRETRTKKSRDIKKVKASTYNCSNCSESFRSKTNLKYHMKVHNARMCNSIRETEISNSEYDNELYVHNSKDFQIDNKSTLNNILSEVAVKEETNEKSFELFDLVLQNSECGNLDSILENKCKSNGRTKYKMKLESETGLYACSKCSYISLKRSNFSRHLNSHIQDKPFLCEECAYSCKSITKLKLHQMTHSGQKPHACDKCPFTSRVRSDLKCHMRIHSDMRPHTCEECGSSFRRAQHLKAHKLMHDKATKSSCQECNFTALSYAAMKKHCLNHSKSHICDLCSETFEKFVDLQVHKVTYHDSFHSRATVKTDPARKKYVCKVCGQSFSAMVYLKSHTVVHSDERPFSCKFCDSKFKRRGDLVAHNLTHANNKPYMCKECPFASARLGDLRAHFRTHTDSRPFACNLCSLRFRKQNHLKQHRATHSEDKPYACSICDFKCKRAEDLKNHMSVHSGERLSCSICKYTCVQKRQMKKHELKHREETFDDTDIAVLETKKKTEEHQITCTDIPILLT